MLKAHRDAQDMTHWPFQVIEKDGAPFIKVQYLGEEKTFSPQEISSMVLLKVRLIHPCHQRFPAGRKTRTVLANGMLTPALDEGDRRDQDR